jgi:8-oxo-dGTP pyrophosphatase MutT (NUDIX family)
MTNTSTKPARTPVVPRRAATILLLRDDPLEVLIIRRHQKQFFGSALVFPGGVVHESDHWDDWLPLIEDSEGLDRDERALRIAGFRETFEETGILLAKGPDGRCVPCVSGTESFIDVVRASGGRLVLSDLVRFGHWITPERSPQRFDTHFFLCLTAEGQEAVCDGGEAVALEWARPEDILARAAGGEASILFPTRMNISRLAESSDAQAALALWRGQEIFTVSPWLEKREGGVAVVISKEAGYCESEYFVPSAQFGD